MFIINCLKFIDDFYFIIIIIHVLYALVLIYERLNEV